VAQESVADAVALIDRAALGRFLAPTVPPFAEMSIELLAGGASNLTFLLELDDRRYVLRRRPLGKSAPRAHDMHREFTAIRALNRVGFPVPSAVEFSDDPAVVGAPFYLMHFVPGRAFQTRADVAGLAPAAAAACSAALIDTLARLHSLDPAAIGLAGFGRPANFVQRRITSWLKQWRAAEHRDYPQVEALGARLLARVPEEPATTLIHGDYRLGNVMFSGEPQPALTSVLDWEMSTIGNPMTDLAHLLVYWEPTRGRLTHPAQLIARHPGFFSSDQLVERYASATDRPVDRLSFYLALEHWRAAVIKDAIYLRATSGPAPLSDDMVLLGAAVHRHLEEAAELLSDVA
jgi:aminoglycoside phosphotransferase (APT) family kinase protein